MMRYDGETAKRDGRPRDDTDGGKQRSTRVEPRCLPGAASSNPQTIRTAICGPRFVYVPSIPAPRPGAPSLASLA